jgi:hypothetical protein
MGELERQAEIDEPTKHRLLLTALAAGGQLLVPLHCACHIDLLQVSYLVG